MHTSRKQTLLRCLVILAAAALLTSSAVGASGTSVKQGGTLREAPVEGIDPVWPGQYSGLLLNATQLTLLAHPDQGGSRIVPEAAAALPAISADRKTYIFTIRHGFRFSDGSPVTAANFAAAFRRLFDPKLQRVNHGELQPSYFALLFSDVAGARAFMQGKAKRIAGVRAKGDKLVIRLLAPRPDLLARLAVPVVTAVPVDLPVADGGLNTPFPSAGPYMVSQFTSWKSFVLVRNPYWRRDLLPWRPANVDRIVGVDPGGDPVRAVEENKLDSIGLRSEELPALVAKYGLNKGRLLPVPSAQVGVFQLNLAGPLFRNNPKLRQAVNYALDRRALVNLFGVLGPLGAKPTDQMLPPGLPGFHDWHIYPLAGPNLAKARALARGNLRGGRAVIYTFNRGSTPRQGQEVKRDLARIGLDVTVKAFEPMTMYAKVAKRGEPWDLAIFWWMPDFADPYSNLNVLFDGQFSGTTMGPGGLDDPVFNRRLREAARLSGEARFQAYALLDRDLMRKAAPVAPYALMHGVDLISPSLGCFSVDWRGNENWVAECKK